MATASQLTSVTSEVYYGEICGIGWSSSSSSYTHTVEYTIGEYTYTENIEAGITIHKMRIDDEIGDNIISQISGTVGTMTVRLHTYNGTKKIGSVGTYIKIRINESDELRPVVESFKITPSVSEKIHDTFGNIFIKGYSKPIFEITSNGGLGSEVKSYVVTDNFSSQTYSFSSENLPYIGETINIGGQVAFYAQSKNMRGFLSDALQKVIDVQDYYSPIINSFTVKRHESNSTSVTINFNCVYADILNDYGESKNSATALLEYQSENSAGWIQCGECDILSEEKVEIKLSSSMDESISYNFRLTVTDLVGGVTVSTSFLPKYSILLHYPKDQKGFGIGKYVENGNFEVGLESEFYENVFMEQNLNINGLVMGDNFGRFCYSGADNCLSDIGLLSTAESYAINVHIIKPFNFVYIRLYIKRLGDITSNSKSYTTICTLRDEFRAGWSTPLTVGGQGNCDIVMNTKGEIRILPYSGVSSTSGTTAIYCAGFYTLNSNSPFYVQNFNKTMTLERG